MIGDASGSRSRARFSISSAISRPGTPSRISGSCTERWKSRTSASGICDSACPYTRPRRLGRPPPPAAPPHTPAHELQERDEREARVDHGADVANRLKVLLGQVL